MEVVLLENIKNLGQIGDVVDVKRGHGRNFLIKYGKALKASKENINLVNKKKAELNQKNLELKKSAKKILDIVDFFPDGSDERQFCSPGINLPIGRLTRTPNGCYPEYHTSADNLDIVKPEYLADTLESYLDIIELFENNRTFKNTRPYGEPHLGRHGLYKKAGAYNIQNNTLALLWVLNQSDGENSLLDITTRSKLPYSEILEASKALYEINLLELVD